MKKMVRQIVGWFLILTGFGMFVWSMLDIHKKPISKFLVKMMDELLFPKTERPGTTKMYVYPGLYCKTRKEAEDILLAMDDTILQHGRAYVYDLRDLGGLLTDFKDMNEGWTDLHGAKVTRIGYRRYGLLLPVPVKLEKISKKMEFKTPAQPLKWEHNEQKARQVQKENEEKKKKSSYLKSWTLNKPDMLNIEFETERDARSILFALNDKIAADGHVMMRDLDEMLGMLDNFSGVTKGWYTLKSSYISQSQDEMTYILHLPKPIEIPVASVKSNVVPFNPKDYLFASHGQAVTHINLMRARIERFGKTDVAWFRDSLSLDSTKEQEKYGWNKADFRGFISIRPVTPEGKAWYIDLPQPKLIVD